MVSKMLLNLVQALQRKELFDHAVDHFELLETHISYILLTGPYAYKFKKPVKFGFLDFSSLALRKFYCEEELRLNRRLALGLYQDLIPITGSEMAPRLRGQGSVLDYCVKLVQFPQAMLLNQVLERGEFEPYRIDALAEQIASFHQRIAIATADTSFGKPELIYQQALANFTELGNNLPSSQATEQLKRLRIWTEQQYGKLVPMFAARREHGYIRECHGDMHLSNMVLLENKITIFDGIEFNPLLNWIDVMSEIAFLLMDLDFRGYPHLAQRCLDRYLTQTGDYAGLAMLNFYRVYRSLVRAMVAYLHYKQTTDDHSWQRCLGHIALAYRYAETSAKPFLMITHGYSGSGKTWLTGRLVSTGNAIRLRSDVERKRLAGLPAQARTMSPVDRGLYQAETTRMTYDYLLELARTVLTAGYPVIVDATFLQRQHRNSFRELAAALKIPFMILDCHAEEAVLRQRILQRGERDASEATQAVLDQQLRNDEPLAAEEQAFIC
jgi:uncharacterized protein